MYGKTLDFLCHCLSHDNLKYPIGKSTFAVDLPLKRFRTTERLKSLHTLFVCMVMVYDTYLDYMLTKFAPNRAVRNVQNFSFGT